MGSTLQQPRQQRVFLLEKRDYLETEKKNFLSVLDRFFETVAERRVECKGRPPIYFKDMVKSLLIMAYHGWSYRRARSDLETAYQTGIINAIPKRSTLCKYMNSKETKEQLEKLIQQSAMPFLEGLQTLILDSTWFGTKMYTGGHNNKPYKNKKKKNKNIPSLAKCRKLHVAILKSSRIIAFAKTTRGTSHDSPHFQEIVSTVIDNGFNINTLLADAGYLSKMNYKFAQDKGVENIFIDFRSNVTGKRSKSRAYKDAFYLYKNDRDYWHEIYRFRVLIEGVWSAIKRKFLNWLRTRRSMARDNEMLLKVLCYNLTILGKYAS